MLERAPPRSLLVGLRAPHSVRGSSRVERRRSGTDAAASTVGDALAFVAELLLGDGFG